MMHTVHCTVLSDNSSPWDGWTTYVDQVYLGEDQEVVGVVVVRGAVGHELLLRHHSVLVRVHVGKHLSYQHHHWHWHNDFDDQHNDQDRHLFHILHLDPWHSLAACRLTDQVQD